MTSSPSSSSGGSTASSVLDISEEKTNGTRLFRLLIDGGTDVLRRFLSSIYAPETLENVLKKNLPKLKKLKSKRVIFDYQWEKLFPGTGVPTDIETFDITLLHLLIREFSYLPSPVTGWHKMPDEDDLSIQAHITRIKCFRNDMCHSVSTGIPESEFEAKWKKISSSLEAIEIDVHRRKIHCLKNDPIDHDKRRTMEEQVKEWQKQELESDYLHELSSCLPDKVPERCVFGRSQEIDKVKDCVQGGTVAVVLITGGPGFGKTTVAETTAHELAKQENGRTVLFCSLSTKRTFQEVATEMIHSCRKLAGQLPENREQWLKEWSKQTQGQVTFVLDNADGVLESNADRELFLATLRAMRMLSKQNVTFVVTSRRTFRDAHLSVIEVKLNPLSLEMAEKVLLSRVNLEENQIKKLTKTDIIVDLCGRVPLALSIIGSLLSGYSEDRLIEHLEQEPMSILEGDGESFHKAITTSFDFLTKAEQDALLVVSIFPGSFDCNAAEVVLKEYLDPGTLPVLILRSLKNSSLVEQAPSHRYHLHPLIRAFAKKTGEARNPQVLRYCEKLACEHFVTRLEENARLFWGKDTCKASMESFIEDRQNFEYFLQVYAEGMVDQEFVTSCQNFLDNFPHTCMYLEKCITPTFYIQILEMLLNCKSFHPEFQPLHRVELLCLLGQEMRRVGEKPKYNDCMEKAHQLYSAHDGELHMKTLSHVFYLQSRARFLSEASKLKKTFDPQPKTLCDKALQICEEKIPDHPETAATLLFAGRNAKRRKDNKEAIIKFQKAFSLFKELLGDHFMTAQCLKDLADFFFFTEKNDQGLVKALEYYKSAMEVMEILGTHDQKESILTLKNYGTCYTRSGNFEAAKRLLLSADLVCNRELEKADHTWKVMVKTELALLYHEVAEREKEASVRKELLDKMETAMKEGLDMHYRINPGEQTVEPLGNKHLIWKVLKLYPKRFPEERYPRR